MSRMPWQLMLPKRYQFAARCHSHISIRGSQELSPLPILDYLGTSFQDLAASIIFSSSISKLSGSCCVGATPCVAGQTTCEIAKKLNTIFKKRNNNNAPQLTSNSNQTSILKGSKKIKGRTVGVSMFPQSQCHQSLTHLKRGKQDIQSWRCEHQEKKHPYHGSRCHGFPAPISHVPCEGSWFISMVN